MTLATTRLLEAAVRLPEGERAELAARLLASLESEIDEGADAAWDAEIARRIDEMDRGLVQPVDEVTARRVIRGVSDGPAET